MISRWTSTGERSQKFVCYWSFDLLVKQALNKQLDEYMTAAKGKEPEKPKEEKKPGIFDMGDVQLVEEQKKEEVKK